MWGDDVICCETSLFTDKSMKNIFDQFFFRPFNDKLNVGDLTEFRNHRQFVLVFVSDSVESFNSLHENSRDSRRFSVESRRLFAVGVIYTCC